MRVCQFRHDGKWTQFAAATKTAGLRLTFPFLQALNPLSNRANVFLRSSVIFVVKRLDKEKSAARYSNFAFIVIFAFRTLDTGHPFSAASAYFWNVAASAPGTLPTTSM